MSKGDRNTKSTELIADTGKGSSNQQGSDYQKYMEQYAGDYQQYMSQGGASKGSSQQGGDYQKYMDQYAGDSMSKGDRNTKSTELIADTGKGSSNQQGSDYQKYMEQYAGDYQQYMSQ